MNIQTNINSSYIIKIFKVQVISLLLLVMVIPKLNAADFYHGNEEVPVFTVDEQQILDEFGIHFLKLKRVSQIRKHNREVKKLVEKYGNFWKDTLINLTSSFGEDKKKFIKYLFSNKSLDYIKRYKNKRNKSHSISYHINGMIAEYKVKTTLKKNIAGMFHFRIKTKNWNKKGKRIKGTNEVFYGSAC